jgi:hypothetical protein
MSTIDTTTLFHFLQTMWSLAWGAMRLDPAAFKAVEPAGTGLLTAAVVFLAGVSEAIGQSVVLFANRVKPRRFALSLLLNGILFIVSVFILAGSIWAIARVIYHTHESFLDLLRSVGLSYVPLLLSFFVLLPYMGTFINRALSVWSFLALLVALVVTMGLVLWQALVCSIFGWALVQVLKYTLGRPYVAFERWLRRITAGVSLTEESPDKLIETIIEQTIDNPKGGKS